MAGRNRSATPDRPLNILALENLLGLVVKSKTGLWPGRAGLRGLAGLMVLGGPHHQRSARTQLPDAFERFLREDKTLRGPMSEMALRLFGATETTREQSLTVREREVGKVLWKGKTVGVEAVRRRKGGRRYTVIERVAQALLDAEVEARERAEQSGTSS
jgi:hypothetical protein